MAFRQRRQAEGVEQIALSCGRPVLGDEVVERAGLEWDDPGDGTPVFGDLAGRYPSQHSRRLIAEFP
jgi:hypothetical protein